MDVRLAVLADYANMTLEGKLNIMGIFGEINPPVLPFVLPVMFLVVMYSAPPAEVGRNQTLEAELIDSEGRRLLGMQSTLVVPPGRRPGAPAEVAAVLALNNVRFEDADDYQFAILVGGQVKTSVPLRVNQPKMDGDKPERSE
jgi:hypothetical protein